MGLSRSTAETADPPSHASNTDKKSPSDSERGPSITTFTTTTITTTSTKSNSGVENDRMTERSTPTLRPSASSLSAAVLALILLLAASLPAVLFASNVRSTKNYDFKETDGSSPGFIMFNLDKIHPSEVFKMESPNRWVSVDVTGAVRVKEPWDYEQLGKDKTIDFWVIITSPNLSG